MTPFEAYRAYVALKSHFGSWGFDYHKYNGRIRLGPDSYERRKDKYFFEKLARHADPVNFLVANLVEDPARWIGDVVRDVACYNERRRVVEALTHVFCQETGALPRPFDSLVTMPPGEHPLLVREYVGGRVSLETATIIATLTGCVPYWRTRGEGDPLLAAASLRLAKYAPFLDFDHDKFRRILVDSFKPAA